MKVSVVEVLDWFMPSYETVQCVPLGRLDSVNVVVHEDGDEDGEKVIASAAPAGAVPEAGAGE